jgi:hypothetical protein
MDTTRVNKHVKRLLHAAEQIIHHGHVSPVYGLHGETFDTLMDWRKIGDFGHGVVGHLTPDECALFILFVIEAEFGE